MPSFWGPPYNIDEITTIRTEAVSDSVGITSHRNDGFRWHEESQASDTFEVITPIGSFDKWQLQKYNLFNFNWPDWEDFYGESFEEKIAGVQQQVIGRYSDKAIIQLFTLELQKKRIDRPCGSGGGWWLGPDHDYYEYYKPCPAEEGPIEPLLDFKMVASADVVENANDQDPRLLERNAEFEAAILDLYNSVKGILSKPIPIYNFSLRILKKN